MNVNKISDEQMLFMGTKVLLLRQKAKLLEILFKRKLKNECCLMLRSPYRTVGLASVSLGQPHSQSAFFEKNEKEPKKNGKRKQKERNSVTT